VRGVRGGRDPAGLARRNRRRGRQRAFRSGCRIYERRPTSAPHLRSMPFVLSNGWPTSYARFAGGRCLDGRESRGYKQTALLLRPLAKGFDCRIERCCRCAREPGRSSKCWV